MDKALGVDACSVPRPALRLAEDADARGARGGLDWQPPRVPADGETRLRGGVADRAASVALGVGFVGDAAFRERGAKFGAGVLGDEGHPDFVDADEAHGLRLEVRAFFHPARVADVAKEGVQGALTGGVPFVLAREEVAKLGLGVDEREVGGEVAEAVFRADARLAYGTFEGVEAALHVIGVDDDLAGFLDIAEGEHGGVVELGHLVAELRGEGREFLERGEAHEARGLPRGEGARGDFELRLRPSPEIWDPQEAVWVFACEVARDVARPVGRWRYIAIAALSKIKGVERVGDVDEAAVLEALVCDIVDAHGLAQDLLARRGRPFRAERTDAPEDGVDGGLGRPPARVDGRARVAGEDEILGIGLRVDGLSAEEEEALAVSERACLARLCDGDGGCHQPALSERAQELFLRERVVGRQWHAPRCATADGAARGGRRREEGGVEDEVLCLRIPHPAADDAQVLVGERDVGVPVLHAVDIEAGEECGGELFWVGVFDNVSSDRLDKVIGLPSGHFVCSPILPVGEVCEFAWVEAEGVDGREPAFSVFLRYGLIPNEQVGFVPFWTVDPPDLFMEGILCVGHRGIFVSGCIEPPAIGERAGIGPDGLEAGSVVGDGRAGVQSADFAAGVDIRAGICDSVVRSAGAEALVAGQSFVTRLGRY